MTLASSVFKNIFFLHINIQNYPFKTPNMLLVLTNGSYDQLMDVTL